MSTASGTRTVHHFAIIEITNGEGVVIGHDKCRDSLGGWANLVRRLEDAIGEHLNGRFTADGEDVHFHGTVSGRVFRFEERARP